MHPPSITHLNAAILSAIVRGEASGQAIRDHMATLGIAHEGPGFYRLMGRMEKAALVSGRYRRQIIDGQIIKERLYRATPVGKKALKGACEFYRKLEG